MTGWLRRLVDVVLEVIKKLTTAKDNETPSWSRIMGIGITLAFFWYATDAYIIRDQVFDPLVFATASGVLVNSVMLAIRVGMKANPGNDLPAATEEPTA